MHIDFILDNFLVKGEQDAVIWNDQAFSFTWLQEKTEGWLRDLSDIAEGSVVAIEGDFSPNSIALFLALAEKSVVIVPLTPSVAHKREEYLQVARTEVVLTLGFDDSVVRTNLEPEGERHPLLDTLRERQHPGLILFSSGSTGKSKAAVHDLLFMLEKYKTPRPAMRTISFLLYDHIGGINTMLHVLANGGCLITPKARTPESVLCQVQENKVEVLPTSPTFLNLLLLSETYKRYDLSSLKLITYGTEPMPESTLTRLNKVFPQIRFQQTYGLSELGILRSKSLSSDSLWVQVGGEGFETRIVDNMLEIKAKSAMLGYLNAPSPFTEDGWFITGDLVEVDGNYIKILGRQSELINVGGEKVFPAEVESVLQTLSNVQDATVYAEKNPIMGNMVCVEIRLQEPEDKTSFVKRMRIHCAQQMQPFKIPTKVVLTTDERVSERFKKMRSQAAAFSKSGLDT